MSDPMEDENITDEEDEEGRIHDDEVLKVIPLDEFIENNGRVSFSDDGDDDGQSTSNASAMEELRDDSVGMLVAHEKDCFVVALAGDRWIASGGEDDKAVLWDRIQSETEPTHKVSHADSVTCVSFNASQTLLASGDMSGKIVITELQTRTTRAELNECDDLEWLFWHGSSDILFAGDKNGMIWMWLIGNQGVAQSKVYGGGSGSRCTCGQLLPGGRRLLAAYEDGTIRLWALKDASSVSCQIQSEPTCMQMHPDQAVVAVGTLAGAVHLLNTGPPEDPSVKVFSSFYALKSSENEANEMEDELDVSETVESLSFGPRGWLAVGRNDGSVCVYELDSSAPRFIFRAEAGRSMNRVEWSSVSGVPLLVTISIDSYIRIFDARDGSLCKELCNGGDEVFDVAIVSADPSLRLLTACSGGSLRIFDA